MGPLNASPTYEDMETLGEDEDLSDDIDSRRFGRRTCQNPGAENGSHRRFFIYRLRGLQWRRS